MGRLDDSDDEEYFDCQPDSSPRNKGVGEVFVDPAKAYAKLKGIKGSRLKFFHSHVEAEKFAKTPVEEANLVPLYPPSPKPDLEACPFSSVNQADLVRFRMWLNKGDFANVKKMIEDNPLVLVTSSDTPTLLQIRLRYNALHVIAANGNVCLMQLLLDYLNSVQFWNKIYPNITDKQSTFLRQQYVLDLYLNSPELGNLETPLHFACKFGHLECVSTLAHHPLTILNPLNMNGQTPMNLAASRLNNTVNNKTASFDLELREKICQVFDENYLVLVDMEEQSFYKATQILFPLTSRKFQALLGLCVPNSCKTFTKLTRIEPCISNIRTTNDDNERKPVFGKFENGSDIMTFSSFGFDTNIIRLRGFAGPMSLEKASSFRKIWIEANSAKGKFKQFSVLRLIDYERGYERQGRFLSNIFGTSWYEYWEFLDDFINVNTENGLNELENYFQTTATNLIFLCNSNNFIMNKQCDSTMPTILTNYDESIVNAQGDLSNEHALNSMMPIFDVNDINLPKTPIKKQEKVNNLTTTSTNNNNNNNSGSIWCSYRSNVLDDSLNESSDYSQSSISSIHSSDSRKSIHTTILSPIVGLLERLTFKSPLYNFLMSPSSPKSLNNNEKTSPKSIKRRLSMIEDQSNKNGQPQVKKYSPDKAKEKQLNNKNVNIPHQLIELYHAFPGKDIELESLYNSKCFDELNITIDATTTTTNNNNNNSFPFEHTYSRTDYLCNYPNCAKFIENIETLLNVK